MIHENIRHFRKAKGLTQEEMAVRLNVVRQTVSKWEKGLSVPDAEVLIQIAQLLEVSVNQLLDVEADNHTVANLSEELAKVNEQLAKKNQREKLVLQANKKKALILYLSFLTLLAALLIKNQILSILLIGACTLAAAVVLYRNLALLTSITTDDLKMGVLRATTFFDIGVLIIGIILAVLASFDMLAFFKDGEKLLALAIVSCVMLFAGIVAPRLPYSKHTGLRLPWTVQDEDTWNVAHRMIGYVSLPCVLLYLGAAFTINNFEAVTLAVMLLWIGIPGGISLVFWWKKYHGKL